MAGFFGFRSIVAAIPSEPCLPYLEGDGDLESRSNNFDNWSCLKAFRCFSPT